MLSPIYKYTWTFANRVSEDKGPFYYLAIKSNKIRLKANKKKPKSVEFAAAIECLVKAYIATYIVSKTLFFSRSDKQQDFAWYRQQTEWN